MKYLAIIDEELLTEGEKIGKEFLKATPDKITAVEIKPVFKSMFVATDGQNVYLTKEHVECLKEFEHKKAIEEFNKEILGIQPPKQTGDNFGWQEYQDIQQTLKTMFAKGYTPAMIKTVMDQIQ